MKRVNSLASQHSGANVEVVQQVDMPELGKVLQTLWEAL